MISEEAEEAVEAAATVILRGIDEGHHAYNIAYAALEAAGPYLMAQAWDEVAASIRNDMEVQQRIYLAKKYKQANPYRSQA